MNARMPLVFDNDCLSSFLWIKRADIINTLFTNQILIPEPVYAEIEKMKTTKYNFLFDDLCHEIACASFKVVELKALSAETAEYLELISMTNPKRIGKGEAAAIVLAKALGGTLASNNLKDILQYTETGEPPYICTDGILYLYYKKGHMTMEEGCAIWEAMKAKKRRLPDCDFVELVRKMEESE